MLEIITFIVLNILSLFVVVTLIATISWAFFVFVSKMEKQDYNKY